MIQDQTFQEAYLAALISEIYEHAAKYDMRFPHAAQHIMASRLGYNEEVVEYVDGAGDRGIDFWYASNGGLYVYQVKTHEPDEFGIVDTRRKFDRSGVTDLQRARSFLLSSTVPDEDHRLTNIKDTLNRMIDNHISQDSTDHFPIYLTLIILGEELTDAAWDELADFESIIQDPSLYQDTSIQFFVELKTINDILASRWREENRDWKNTDGENQRKILLTPMRQSDTRHYLNDNKSAIFYCRAYDLVKAYSQLGYQIFEPNVRANIKNSEVNAEIQQSASVRSKMKEFRFLNNGLTITCNHYRLPAGKRPAFEIDQPGIINGLQTVISLYNAYRVLPKLDQEFFQEKCYVLVRLLRYDSVSQITDVVLATNNQNPMQPRNLVSNSAEQRHFAYYFATELGWFYEAKQGAWDGYKKDHSRWRPNLRRKPKDFKALKGYKKLDNHDLAQDWLAFLGFASKAANDRRYLFNRKAKGEGYYDLIFMRRQRSHGFEYYKTVEEAINDSMKQSPDPAIMLVAHIARLFASKVVPSSQANRSSALERANVKDRESISPIEEEQILSNDSEYKLNQALNAMSLVFVEFVGYSLFTVFGEKAHDMGYAVLRNHSWKKLKDELNWTEVIAKAKGEDRNLHENDTLIVMWEMFRESVSQVVSGSWKLRYQNARYKPRFILNNRSQIYQEINLTNEGYLARVPVRRWTHGIQDGEGFFGYIYRVLTQA